MNLTSAPLVEDEDWTPIGFVDGQQGLEQGQPPDDSLPAMGPHSSGDRVSMVPTARPRKRGTLQGFLTFVQ